MSAAATAATTSNTNNNNNNNDDDDEDGDSISLVQQETHYSFNFIIPLSKPLPSKCSQGFHSCYILRPSNLISATALTIGNT